MAKVVVAAVALLLAGCGALFNGGPATVMLNSTPNDAEVWINGNRMGTNPTSLQLSKNQNHTVVFRRTGYVDNTFHLNRMVDPTYVILDVLGGLPPVVVDAVTGAWYVLPMNSVNVTLAQAENDDDSGLVQRGVLSQVQLAQARSGVPIRRILTVNDLLPQ
jgi:hypothetical protein